MALVVITGGARSGKSSAAQRLAEARLRDGVPVTVAVFGRADDDEMRERIARHRADRPDGFRTLEVSRTMLSGGAVDDWLGRVDDDHLLVIDCLGTMLGLVMEIEWCGKAGEGLGEANSATLPFGYAEAVSARFQAFIDAIALRHGDTLVVTNEVGAGIVPEWPTGRLFRDVLGAANRALVVASDAAYFAVAGRLISLADLPAQVSWPED